MTAGDQQSEEDSIGTSTSQETALLRCISSTDEGVLRLTLSCKGHRMNQT